MTPSEESNKKVAAAELAKDNPPVVENTGPVADVTVEEVKLVVPTAPPIAAKLELESKADLKKNLTQVQGTNKGFIFNHTAIDEKFKTLDLALKNVAGKKGHNPYLWFAKHVQPLADKVDMGRKGNAHWLTKELFDSIMAIPNTPNTIVCGDEAQGAKPPGSIGSVIS